MVDASDAYALSVFPFGLGGGLRCQGTDTVFDSSGIKNSIEVNPESWTQLKGSNEKRI